MKKIICLCFVLGSFFVQAQTYHRFLENTSWYERLSMFGFYYSWYYTSNDTLISGNNYTIVRESTTSTKYYVREDSITKKVYLNDLSQPEYLLYDFSLIPGSIFNYQGSSFLLDSIDSVSTQLGIRKRFHFHNTVTSFYQTAPIEGVGSTQHPFMFIFMGSDPVYNLICSYVETSQYYYWGGDSCPPNIYIGVNEFNEQKFMTIYPNPATTEVTINFGKTTSCNIQLANILGEVLEQTQINSSSHTLDMSNRAKGIYFITVTDEQGNKTVRKIVKM